MPFLFVPLLAQVAPPNSVGISMGHIHIVTDNPEVQKKIWVDTLGGKPIKVGPLDFAMFPGVLIGFRKGDASGGTETSVVDHLGFLVRDAAAVKAKLVAAGAEIVREFPDAPQFFAMLPDGIKVEFFGDPHLEVPIKHHHLHFASHQLDEMRSWYAKFFAAEPMMRGRFKSADLPGVNLSWNPSDTPTLPTKGRIVDHIGFEVQDINAFCAKLEAAGLTLEMKPTPRPDLGLTIAFIVDPWGTRIEFTEGLNRFR